MHVQEKQQTDSFLILLKYGFKILSEEGSSEYL